ncbi:MAG: FAD:protein FMN transferase [Bacteroidales bacterium]|jgi:thiamine biosynthesis lipoprotein|nr:FAD:protein FMN transferase [Bacteroidales bacterium]
MQYIVKLWKLIAVAMLFCGCHFKQAHHFRGMAFGTYYAITYEGKIDPDLPAIVDSLLTDLSGQFSVFDSLSLLSRINKGEDCTLTSDMIYVIEQARGISVLTDGAFDPTVEPLADFWGFGKQKKTTPADTSLLDSIRAFVGYAKIHREGQRLVKTNPRVQLNFNAIAKGFAVDKIAVFLQKKGYKNGVVDIGGEVRAIGTKKGKPWKIGIQTPTEDSDDPIEASCFFYLQDQSVATSGNYRNYIEQKGQRYSHIINPASGYPEKNNLLSVTVIAENCTIADGLATALMVMGLENAMQWLTLHPQYAAYFIYDEQGTFTTFATPNFPLIIVKL